MKCRHCNCCHRGWFPSRPDEYVCTGVKEPFVIENIDHDCTEYISKAEEINPEIVRCPYCNESYYQELYKTTTCLYSPMIYKDGELISKVPNTTRTVCFCLSCGKDFSYTSKE